VSFRACIATVVLFAITLAAPGAAAQGDPSLPIETSILSLAHPDPKVREAAAEALGWIGPAAAPAASALTEALADPDLRQSASFGLGRIGPAAAPAVPALADVLADPDQDLRRIAAAALAGVATSLHDETAVTALGALRETQEALETHIDPEIREHAAAGRRAVRYLELQSWERVRRYVLNSIYAHSLYAFTIGAALIWLVFCLALFWLNPVALLRVNNVLRPFDFKLPDWLGGMTVSVRHLLLVGVLNHQPRVLDAWVSSHVAKARENFERKRTVEERSVHVPVPAHLGDETIPELKGQHLRRVFGAGTGRLLIWGEGGSGKTSIACQIGRWAMANAPDQRPAPYLMLPVLIERELDFEVGEEKDSFTETVRGDLETLMQARVGDDLLGALLERRRVLVIIDHLSEMTEAARRRVRPDVPDFPAAALIVTSRLEERLGDRPKATLQPMRVTGDYLFEFMGAYLRARGVREEFPDREFGLAGRQIADLVGERAVTVLLVKLYLDRLIEMKHRSGDLDKEIPESIPSLMLQYLNDINRAVLDEVRRDERAVHRDAEAVAWACLEERFRPGPASIDRSVISKLAAIEAANEMGRLAYLETRLRLIETVEPEREQVRFLLDPVGEYLAGLHLVRKHGKDATAWKFVLEGLDAGEGGFEAIRGFILALRDCCLYRPGDVPDFLGDELAKRGGLDLEKLREARRRERVSRYARQLFASDPDDRRVAAETLGRIGFGASDATPALVKVLEDEEREVRLAAVRALGGIGPGAVEAVPALLKRELKDSALKSWDADIRQEAAEALGQIGPQAVPALVEALEGEDGDARWIAASALGQMGPRAAEAVPALINVLKCPDVNARLAAASALDRIGPRGSEPVAALIDVLKGQHAEARQAAARALGEIGPGASEAVPALVKALQDEEDGVRLAAADALRWIGPGAAEAVPALIRALQDEEDGMRLAAAGALCQIKSFKILIADSDESSRRLLTHLLTQYGHQIEAIDDGLATVNAVRDNHYDLVLMEKSMPTMDGLEASILIRAMKGAKGSVPIIAVTASAMKGDDEQCFRAGMNEYLTKPIDRISLLESVTKWGGVMNSRSISCSED